VQEIYKKISPDEKIYALVKKMDEAQDIINEQKLILTEQQKSLEDSKKYFNGEQRKSITLKNAAFLEEAFGTTITAPAGKNSKVSHLETLHYHSGEDNMYIIHVPHYHGANRLSVRLIQAGFDACVGHDPNDRAQPDIVKTILNINLRNQLKMTKVLLKLPEGELGNEMKEKITTFARKNKNLLQKLSIPNELNFISLS
jgi:hypothetical protein